MSSEAGDRAIDCLSIEMMALIFARRINGPACSSITVINRRLINRDTWNNATRYPSASIVQAINRAAEFPPTRR